MTANDNGKPGGKPGAGNPGAKQTPKPRMKKSETLEVRIPHETKQAFLNACREDGTTASEVVRDQVQSYLDAREQPPQQEKGKLMQFSPTVRRYGPRVAIGSLTALGLTAMAVLPSAAAPDIKAQFARLDVNGDGVLSVEEFLGPSQTKVDGDEHNIVVETRSIINRSEDGPKKPVTLTQDIKGDAFTFWLPDEIGAAKAGKPTDQQREFKFISHQEVRELKDGEDAPAASTQTYSFSVDDLRKKEFSSIDANADGKVSLEEYRAQQTAMLTRGFEILDANSDKSLSQDEYARIVAPPLAKVKWKGGADMPEPPKVDMPAMTDVPPEAIKAAFTRLDANKDGKLSLQEYLPKA